MPATTPAIPAIGRIALTVDDQTMAFSELVGLTTEVELGTVVEAADQGPVLSRVPARAVPPPVTLRRAATDALDLWNWHDAVRQGDLAAARRTATLTLFTTDGKPAMAFVLVEAWPAKLDLTPATSGAQSPLVETVTLTGDSLTRTT